MQKVDAGAAAFDRLAASDGSQATMPEATHDVSVVAPVDGMSRAAERASVDRGPKRGSVVFLLARNGSGKITGRVAVRSSGPRRYPARPLGRRESPGTAATLRMENRFP